MGNFFANIYYLFVGLFGQHLSDYLWGYDCQTSGFGPNVVYLPIGLTMTAITIVSCVIFYFVINHPRFNKWWHWTIYLLFVALINWVIAGIWVKYHLDNGLIPDCLRFTEGIENISAYHCWMFGLANGIISAVLFFLTSIVIKRWSRNCRHTPFESKLPKRNK